MTLDFLGQIVQVFSGNGGFTIEFEPNVGKGKDHEDKGHAFARDALIFSQPATEYARAPPQRWQCAQPRSARPERSTPTQVPEH